MPKGLFSSLVKSTRDVIYINADWAEFVGEIFPGSVRDTFDLSKAAHHKYIRRVPAGTDAKGRKRYRYFYKVTGGGGIAHDREMVVGSAFQIEHDGKTGHFHIEKVEADELTVRHDESGKTVKLSRQELKDVLHAHHATEIEQARKRIKQDAEDVRAYGSEKQKQRHAERSKANEALTGEGGHASKGEIRPDDTRRVSAYDQGVLQRFKDGEVFYLKGAGSNLVAYKKGKVEDALGRPTPGIFRLDESGDWEPVPDGRKELLKRIELDAGGAGEFGVFSSEEAAQTLLSRARGVAASRRIEAERLQQRSRKAKRAEERRRNTRAGLMERAEAVDDTLSGGSTLRQERLISVSEQRLSGRPSLKEGDVIPSVPSGSTSEGYGAALPSGGKIVSVSKPFRFSVDRHGYDLPAGARMPSPEDYEGEMVQRVTLEVPNKKALARHEALSRMSVADLRAHVEQLEGQSERKKADEARAEEERRKAQEKAEEERRRARAEKDARERKQREERRREALKQAEAQRAQVEEKKRAARAGFKEEAAAALNSDLSDTSALGNFQRKTGVGVVKEGRRIYFTGNTYKHRDAIKQAGGRWDGASKRWWISSTKWSQSPGRRAALGEEILYKEQGAG